MCKTIFIALLPQESEIKIQQISDVPNEMENVTFETLNSISQNWQSV